MCVHVFSCLHLCCICVHVHMCLYLCWCQCAWPCVYVCLCLSVLLSTCIHVYMCPCMSVYVCACLCVSVGVWVCMLGPSLGSEIRIPVPYTPWLLFPPQGTGRDAAHPTHLQDGQQEKRATPPPPKQKCRRPQRLGHVVVLTPDCTRVTKEL